MILLLFKITYISNNRNMISLFSSTLMFCLLCVKVLQKPTGELKQQLAACSKRVAGAVTELIQSAEAMKGNDSHTPFDRAAYDHLHSEKIMRTLICPSVN